VGELEAEVSRSEGEIAAIYEPLVGKAEDPRGRLREMITRNREEIQEQRDALKAKEISKVELSGEFKAKTDTVAQLGERIEEYIAERERRVGLKRRMTVYSEAKNLLQQIRDKYKDAREMIRTNLINVLRETLRVEFEKLYAYEDFHDVKVSDDYEVSLEGPVGEINAHNLSAGQKAIASIAFRLAVAKAMEMRIGCWIIDEPTQNIGKAEVEALADVLADTSEIPQIVVASHHEALGRHGNVVSLGIRRGETVLGEGSQPLAPTIDGGEGTVASNGPAK
jgi:DNA repair exonuclease SbcCD ATPase subunit